MKELSSKHLIALAFAVVLLATGCGGSGDTGSDRTSTTSSGRPQSYTVNGRSYTVQASTTVTTADLEKAEFIGRANQLCKEGWDTIVDNFAKFSGWQKASLNRQQRFARTVHSSLLAGIDFHIFDNLHFLGAPEGDEREIEEMIGAMQLAVERGGKRRFTSTRQILLEFRDFTRRAGRYGLDECLVDRTHLSRLQVTS